MTALKVCKRCGREVVVNADTCDLFEDMHWLCFHLEYEHTGDPDEACTDPSCPWWQIDVFKDKLRNLNIDPESVIEEAIGEQWKG